MTIQVDFWQLVSLLIAFISASFGAVKVLLAQFDKRLEVQLEAQKEARDAERLHWDSKFAAIEAASREEAGQWQRVERELMALKAELPLHYVRREDYIRGQSVIEAKIDALALRIQNMALKEGNND